MASEAIPELSERGLAIYEEKLKPILEPGQNNRYIATHVPTEDYAVAASSGDAMREILKRHPVDGQLVIRKIGSEPEPDLAARALGGHPAAPAGRKNLPRSGSRPLSTLRNLGCYNGLLGVE